MRRHFFLSVLLSSLLWTGGAWGSVYYVDCAADGDAGAGTSTASNVAWKTIAKANSSSFSAGDSVLFNKGCTWREQLTVPSSGSAGSPITFGAYGSGAKPIIKGSDLISPGTSWTADVLGEETGGVFSTGLEDEVDAFTTDFTGKTTNGTNTLTISTAAGTFNNGVKGAKVTFDNTNYQAFATKTIADQTLVYVRMYFKLNSNFAFNATFKGISLINIYDGATLLGEARVMSTGTVNQFKLYSRIGAIGGSVADVYVGSNGEIAVNTWYRVELMFKAGTGADGGIQVWLDGISKGSVVNRNVTAYAADNVIIGPATATSTGPPTSASELYWDDVKVDSSAVGAYSAGASTAVWNTTVTTQPSVAWFDNVAGTKESAKANLNAVREWFWADNVLSVYSTSDPDTAYTAPGIESAARDYSVLSAKEYTTISNISFLHGGNGGATIGFGTGAVNGTVDNCDFSNSANQHIGIWGTSTGNFLVSNNTMAISGLAHNSGGGSAIDSDVTDGSGLVITVERNTITSVGAYVGSQYHDHGIYHKDGRLIWRYNNQTDGGTETGAMVKISGSSLDNCEIYNNIISKGSGTQTWGVLLEYPSGGHAIYNNVFYGVGSGVWQTGTAEGVTIKNNIFHTTTYKFLRATTTTGFSSDYNLYYNGPASPFTWGVTEYNLADWKTNSSQDASSLSGDPLFVSTVTPDFSLQATSPARDAGVSVGLTADYLGNGLSGAAWDIGAYEYQAAAGGTTPTRIPSFPRFLSFPNFGQ